MTIPSPYIFMKSRIEKYKKVQTKHKLSLSFLEDKINLLYVLYSLWAWVSTAQVFLANPQAGKAFLLSENYRLSITQYQYK